MKNNFYAGHTFNYIQHFLDVTPKNHSKTISFSLACCIHHICRYKKTHQIILEKKYLKLFGLKRQYIKKYLDVFSKAGLLTYSIKQGRSPIITLLIPISSLPSLAKAKKNKKILNNYISCKHVSNDTSTCIKRYKSHVSNDTSEKFSKKQENQPSQQEKQGKQDKGLRQVSKEGRGGTKELMQGVAHVTR